MLRVALAFLHKKRVSVQHILSQSWLWDSVAPALYLAL